MTVEELKRVLSLLYGQDEWPKPFRLLSGLDAVADGFSYADAARLVGTSSQRLKKLTEAPDVVAELLGPLPPEYESKVQKVRGTIGQLIIGNLAERVFEQIYKETVGTSELRLEDDRSTGGDTDYLVKNGQDRQVFRLNIKFHGSQFRKARELVELDPENCFALATYKIYSALQKQEREHLPYIFVIVGVPNLTGATVGSVLPEPVAEFATRARHSPKFVGKRKIEDVIVRAMTARPADFGAEQALIRYEDQIRRAPWKVLSARRADLLLREKLFDRAYALRVRGFAMNYRGAELDMHFSIDEDLHPLEELLSVLRDGGMPALISRLERGTF
ncbi:MAG: hypothetical protein ACREFF_07930 [Candidatus Udaeobacter sp.]